MWISLILIIISIICKTDCFGVLETLGVAAASAFGYKLYDSTRCRFVECCQDPWIRIDPLSLATLKQNITDQLYGQPFAKDIVYKAVYAHVTDDSPRKPLVMSFHGGPGTGKNHLSNIIARSLFLKGIQSNYFLRFAGNDKFPHHDSHSVRQYRSDLKKLVENKLKECKRSLIVIDEVDKIPVGVLDVLTPFFDYHSEVKEGDVDARYSIFIFSSNTGSTQIMRVVYDAWRQGKKRTDLMMRDFEKIINLGAFNEKGGFRGSDIIARSMVDHHVPFLPLEKKHVKRCAQDHIRSKYLTSRNDEFIDQAMEELEFFPPDTQVYSRNGCKKIDRKIDMLWNN